MVEEIKNRTVYTAPIQVFSPGSKPRKSSIFGPFRPKTLCLDPHFRVGDPLSDHQNRFFTCKTQNQANFLVFEGFLGEKILHQYYALTWDWPKTWKWEHFGLVYFFYLAPREECESPAPKSCRFALGTLVKRRPSRDLIAARGVFQSPCPTQSRTGKFWKMGIFVNRIWHLKGVICRFQTSKNEHILRENVCILWEFWWFIWIFVMFHKFASYL